jgi:YD repeat-containing protein
MKTYQLIISGYLLIGVFTLFFPPFSTIIKDFFGDFKTDDRQEKLVKIIAAPIVIVIVLLLYPIIYVVRLLKDVKSKKEEQDKEISTEKIRHSSKDIIVEERDYSVRKNKLVEVRRFEYDDNDRLTSLTSYDKSNTLKWTKKFFYNEKGQRFAETSKQKNSEIEIRKFHLFDKQNRIIATYSELENGHQYCHELAYDKTGNEIVTSMITLRRDIDLYDIFKDALKKQTQSQLSFPKSYRSSTRQPSRQSWSCSICDGDESTGCLYHDPTECPRWT